MLGQNGCMLITVNYCHPMVTQVVWIDVILRKDQGGYRTGVKYVDIAKDDLRNLKKFLGILAG